MTDTQQKITKIIDGDIDTIEATVAQRGSKGAQTVEIVDSSGNQVTDFGGNTATGSEGTDFLIGITAVQITPSGTTQSVLLQNDHDNLGTVWVGGSDVKSNGTGGRVRLEPGEGVSIDLDINSSALYVVANQTDQRVYKFILT